MEVLEKLNGIETLQESIKWLEQVIIRRLKGRKPESVNGHVFSNGHKPVINNSGDLNQLNHLERVVLLLALLPHLNPQRLDEIFTKYLKSAGDFPQFGGLRGKNFRGFLPTGETAMYLLAGNDLDQRFKVQEIFEPDHFFAKQQILWLEEPPNGEPLMSGKLIMSPEYIDLLTTGKVTKPRFGSNFPAREIHTKMVWDDLVLPQETIDQIRDLENWLNYGNILLEDWHMDRKLKPGYRVLFHGPPGTGKTLTASLLGKYTGREVFKIDLSLVVSKFIGETEKNLANLFDKAENKNWILFFDEADALFGKRTNVRDAHDKYANQEVSFLLQRTENYAGLVILATNFKNNIDDAFARRFQSHIYFPIPSYSERYRLWQQAFPEMAELDAQIDLSAIARQYELTGAHIMNVVQHACLNALANQARQITKSDILDGIKKEFSKEGKVL